jgi:hypothetical protein
MHHRRSDIRETIFTDALGQNQVLQERL